VPHKLRSSNTYRERERVGQMYVDGEKARYKYVDMNVHVHTYIYIRPTRSIMYVPLLVYIFHKSILLIVHYKHLKS